MPPAAVCVGELFHDADRSLPRETVQILKPITNIPANLQVGQVVPMRTPPHRQRLGLVCRLIAGVFQMPYSPFNVDDLLHYGSQRTKRLSGTKNQGLDPENGTGGTENRDFCPENWQFGWKIRPLGRKFCPDFRTRMVIFGPESPFFDPKSPFFGPRPIVFHGVVPPF
jgi:hypothetical protein